MKIMKMNGGLVQQDRQKIQEKIKNTSNNLPQNLDRLFHVLAFSIDVFF
jgi:hypothetical protein